MHIFICVVFLCLSIGNTESYVLPTASTELMTSERVIYSQKDISCGNNRAKTCSQCGNTSAHCNGDCGWISEKCQKKNQQEYNGSKPVNQNNDVSCGNNRADICLQCGHTAEYCNGDCIWASGKCKNRNNTNLLQEKEIPVLKGNTDVSCGNNRAEYCLQCGNSAAYCNGDCVWKSGKCQNKYTQKKVKIFNNISCGNNRANMCSQCGNKAAHCNGDCIWISGKCQYKNEKRNSNQKVVKTTKENKNVTCGNNRANACSKCGNTLAHCNGDCIWISGKCLHKNGQNDSNQKVITTMKGNNNVNCGNNRASTCSQCGNTAAHCNGDCIWMSEKCQHKNDQNISNPNVFRIIKGNNNVSCGNNRAMGCSKCGSSAANCNGDCIWISGTCQHKNDQIDSNKKVVTTMKGNNDVNCGNNRAKTCSQCGNTDAYCNGDCIWMSEKCHHKHDQQISSPNVFTIKGKNHISCGNNRERVCSECGNTAAHCNGDCIWISGKCQRKNDPNDSNKKVVTIMNGNNDVNCGNNRARICSQCGNTAAHCNGDCIWMSEKCQHKNHQNVSNPNVFTPIKGNNDVSCGNSRARTCSKCGNTHAHCNGDCIWISGKCQHKNAQNYSNQKVVITMRGNNYVNCGNHRARTCSLCGNTATHCNGDCIWMSEKCQYKNDQNVSNPNVFTPIKRNNYVSCGNNRARACSQCGNTAAHCNGDCTWISRKCQHKNDQNNSNKKAVTTMKGNNDVNCGNNRAMVCSQCGNTDAYCNGDCIWKSGKCLNKRNVYNLKSKKIHSILNNSGVNCGNHRLNMCSQCGNKASYCNGDCIWKSGKCQNKQKINHLKAKQISSIISKNHISCGNKRVDSCSQCGVIASHCTGDCAWISGKCQNKNKQNNLRNKNYSYIRMGIGVNCGNNRAHNCSQCGNTAAHCNGECMWASGKCQYKDIQVSGETPESEYNGKSNGDKKYSDIGDRVKSKTENEKFEGNSKRITTKLEGEKEKKKEGSTESSYNKNTEKQKKEDKSEEVNKKEFEKKEDKVGSKIRNNKKSYGVNKEGNSEGIIYKNLNGLKENKDAEDSANRQSEKGKDEKDTEFSTIDNPGEDESWYITEGNTRNSNSKKEEEEVNYEGSAMDKSEKEEDNSEGSTSKNLEIEEEGEDSEGSTRYNTKIKEEDSQSSASNRSKNGEDESGSSESLNENINGKEEAGNSKYSPSEKLKEESKWRDTDGVTEEHVEIKKENCTSTRRIEDNEDFKKNKTGVPENIDGCDSGIGNNSNKRTKEFAQSIVDKTDKNLREDFVQSIVDDIGENSDYMEVDLLL